MSLSKTADRLSKNPFVRPLRLVGVALLLSATGLASAHAQQAYYRGEAEQDDSVVVNLSVIDKLTNGAAAAPALPSFAAPAYGSNSYGTAPSGGTPLALVPPSSAPAPSGSANSGLAAPPSAMPQSTLLAPGGSSAPTTVTPAPKPATIPSPAAPAPKPSAPPPKPSITAAPAPADAPTPAPMPKPAPTPAPAPAAVPESTIEAPATETASTEAAPAVEAPAAETAMATPEPAPAPMPEPTPEPEPAPEPIAAPAPPPDPSSETAVAAIDLTAVDQTGVARNDDGVSILFASESQDLPGGANAALDEIAATMKSQPDATLKLLGYSEAIGESPSKPRRLSLFRALAVRTYLLKQGIDSRRMTVQALGSKDPETERPKNRVDIVVSAG